MKEIITAIMLTLAITGNASGTEIVEYENNMTYEKITYDGEVNGTYVDESQQNQFGSIKAFRMEFASTTCEEFTCNDEMERLGYNESPCVFQRTLTEGGCTITCMCGHH